MTRSNLIDLQVIYHTLNKAGTSVCVRETEDGLDVWLPLSEVEFEPTVPRPGGEPPRRHDIVTLTGPEWLLTERGLL